MDILKELDTVIAQDEVGTVHKFYQPNGELYLAPDGTTPCTMTILGAESERVKKATEKAQRKLGRRGKDDNPVQTMRIERAAAAVTEWTGWTLGAEPAQCTPENLRLLCRAQHILVQIEGYRDEHADFFESTSTR